MQLWQANLVMSNLQLELLVKRGATSKSIVVLKTSFVRDKDQVSVVIIMLLNVPSPHTVVKALVRTWWPSASACILRGCALREPEARLEQICVSTSVKFKNPHARERASGVAKLQACPLCCELKTLGSRCVFLCFM